MPTSDAAPCERLEWDSAFFGRGIGRLTATDAAPVDLDGVQAWRRANEVECLYCLVDPADRRTLRALERQGFQLVDMRLTLTRPCAAPLPAPQALGAGLALRPATLADVPDLRAMAGESFRGGRFFHDPHFPRERCRELYATWIEKSCQGWAEVVLVAELEGRPAGFCTGHYDARGGRVGLLAVAAAASRRGVGRALMEANLSALHVLGADCVTVITQGDNLAAYNLYRKLGFETTDWGLWYHGWFDD